MEIRNGLRKTFPKGVKPTPHRHDVLAAIWGISSLCVISTKRGHGLDVMSAVDGEELLVIAFKSFVSICMLFLLFNFVLLVELVLVTPHTERLTSTVMLLGLADPAMCTRRCAPHRRSSLRLGRPDYSGSAGPTDFGIRP